MEQREVWDGPASDMGLKEIQHVCPHTYEQALAHTCVLLSVHPEIQRCLERDEKSQKWKEGEEKRRTPRDTICSSLWHWKKGDGEGPGPLQVSERKRRTVGTSAKPGISPSCCPLLREGAGSWGPEVPMET